MFKENLFLLWVFCFEFSFWEIHNCHT